MAQDEAIMNQVGSLLSPPTIRLYRWQPACLSLGLAQPVSDVNFTRLGQFGWDVVRRPTGGRAILHTDELTYSVIAPEKHPLMAGTLLESYQRISAALLHAMHALNVPAISVELPNQSNRNKPVEPVCFEVPSNFEIACQGKKLIGSAQSRRKNAVLQHGAIPLFGDISRIVLALTATLPKEEYIARNRVRERAATLEDILGHRISWEQCSQAVISGFQAIGVHCIPGKLTEIENQNAEVLFQEKYSNSLWTNRM